MKIPDNKVILFNIAAGFVTFASVVAVMRSLLLSSSVAPCTERYTNGTLLALERGGVLLVSADLQARLAGKDVGLGDNVEIARVNGGPSPVAMGVKLAKGSASPHASEGVKGGLSFPWEPRSARGKTAACLAYSMLLPANFDFHRGGVLPGIRGEEAEQARSGFVTRLTWQGGGNGGMNNNIFTTGESRSGAVDIEPFALPTGRWLKIEQEVVLNTPGETDGTLRLWVDGRLVVAYEDFIFRERPDVTVNGVAVDAYYGNEDPSSGAPKDATVWFSPFEIRWK